jgi:hypothetical protein
MATNTIAFVSERGMSCTASGTLTPMSNCVHKIASPRSVEVSKWFFGCDTMNGIELDNHDTGGGCEVMSSHLETRVFGLTTVCAILCKDYYYRLLISISSADDGALRCGFHTIHNRSATGGV